MDAKPIYCTDLGEASRHLAWTFGRLRFLSCLLKDQIKMDSLWEDFEQELKTIAYDAWLQNLTMPETWRYASRRIRAFWYPMAIGVVATPISGRRPPSPHYLRTGR